MLKQAAIVLKHLSRRIEEKDVAVTKDVLDIFPVLLSGISHIAPSVKEKKDIASLTNSTTPDDVAKCYLRSLNLMLFAVEPFMDSDNINICISSLSCVLKKTFNV